MTDSELTPMLTRALPQLNALARKMHRRLFLAWPDVSHDDLAAEAIMTVWKRRATFDPERSAFATWATRTANSTILDMKRARDRRIGAKQVDDVTQKATTDKPAQLHNGGTLIADLELEYARAKATTACRNLRRGHSPYSPAQQWVFAKAVQRLGPRAHSAVCRNADRFELQRMPTDRAVRRAAQRLLPEGYRSVRQIILDRYQGARANN